MIPVALSPDHPLNDGRTARSPLVRALRAGTSGERPEITPVWFMRQAGRSLPEYRAAREGTTMLGACLDPALASEITLQPVRRHAVDAGIFFSDIVVPLLLAGVEVDIVPGVGPVMGQAYRTPDDVARLVESELTPQALEPIAEAVARTVDALGSTPLIGFAGAPFTLAAYLVEGRPSRDHLAARALLRGDPDTWQRLVDWAADLTGTFLRAQVAAGASAAQLFDSWAGSLSLADYAQGAAGASTRALAHVAGLDVPVIHFGTGTGHLLPAMRDAATAAGARDVTVGVDYRTPLDEAARTLGGTVPVQGNVDPALLAAPWDVLEAHVRDVLRRGRSAPGHVVNLGHGVPPDTDPTVLTRVVDLVHEVGAVHEAAAQDPAAR
ncbi:uroporphyrinogen decarboxylase [Cellulosimicrobium marinum]|uniref:uroporphyrinogen decarboxylase n=1 Tax=Cellulosimicrobium marinum TaxID=1638992 RepID=UPI001E3377EF|nr:uroporphyrinogen decarboxylase [Cellulosimicrobium marinum]MCB7135669.1 uroporphyrinogen decarboxylase [Cellulosimicrobium marinum]